MGSVMRFVDQEDWRALRAIRLWALTESPDAFGSTAAREQEFSEQIWRDRASGAGPTILVFDDDQPVAMGGVYVSTATEAMIWGMWTDPRVRGAGHATRVLQQLMTWCREHQRNPSLSVSEGNGAARTFYLAHGFEATGEWEPLRPGSALRCELLRVPCADPS